MNELGIQRLLVDAALDDGAFAFKASHRFLKGVLDLSVQYEGLVHVWIEVKYEPRFQTRLKRVDLDAADWNKIKDREQVRVELTPHQRTFTANTHRTGGAAGFLMVVAMKNGRYALAAGARPPSHGVLYLDGTWWIKERGGRWPIREVVRSLQPRITSTTHSLSGEKPTVLTPK